MNQIRRDVDPNGEEGAAGNLKSGQSSFVMRFGGVPKDPYGNRLDSYEARMTKELDEIEARNADAARIGGIANRGFCGTAIPAEMENRNASSCFPTH